MRAGARLVVSMSFIGLTTLMSGGFTAAIAQGVDPTANRFNQIDIAADASREVQNDLMFATLFVEATDPNPTALAAMLNKTTNDALKIAPEFKATKMRSGSYQTFPQSDRAGKITGWRGRAEVKLEGRDFREIGNLIGRLQQSMQLGGITFGVSPELRRQSQDELITEAIAAWRARGDLVRQSIGGRAVKIRRMSVTTGSGAGPRPMIAMRAADSSMTASAPAPQFEAGTSQIQVNVQGTIEVE